jgi:hypothetical protein
MKLHNRKDTTRTSNCMLETLAWGMFLVWWGMTDSDFGLFPFLPHGTGWVGIGLILLGLNVARSLNDIPTSGVTITLGIFALIIGGLQLAVSILGLPLHLPVFAILLIVLGGIVLTRALLRERKTILAATY